MIRTGRRDENERSASNTVFERGRASRKIDKIDKIARPRFDARELNCQLVPSIHRADDRDAGRDRGNVLQEERRAASYR